MNNVEKSQTDTKMPKPVVLAQYNQPRIKKHSVRLLIYILSGIVLLAGSSISGYLYSRHVHKKATAALTTTTATSSVSQNSTLSHITLFDTPQKLSEDLKFFKSFESFGKTCASNQSSDCTIPMVKASDITYYQIGVTAGNQRIIVARDDIQVNSDFNYTAIELKPGTYRIFASQNSTLLMLLHATSENIATSTKQFNDFEADLSPTVRLSPQITHPHNHDDRQVRNVLA